MFQGQGRRAIEIRSFATDGAVQCLREGIVDNADRGDEVNGEAERDADVGVGMDEVCCAVDRVDDERWVSGKKRARSVGFFAHEAFVRVVSVGFSGVEGAEKVTRSPDISPEVL